jgi:hypothetical protein
MVIIVVNIFLNGFSGKEMECNAILENLAIIIKSGSKEN